MRLLLDTHTFVWWDSNPRRLSARALAACGDPTNELILSVVSLWELQVKHQIGKLTLHRPLAAVVSEQQRAGAFALLPVRAEHVLSLDGLPLIHGDPFDRLLVAQALQEQAPLVTADPLIAQYPVTVIW